MEPEELTLDDAFAEPETEIVEEAVEEAGAVEAKAETEAEEKPEGKTEEDSTPESKEKEPWTITAVMDERDKRQKAVAEAEDLRKQLEDLRPKEAKISMFEDEDGARKQDTESITSDVREQLLAQSEAFAVMQLGQDEVQAAADWAANVAPMNPEILRELQESKLPYHTAVELHKKAQAWKEQEDPDAYRAKIRAEVLEELKADGQATEANESGKRDAITPSLASQRGAGNESAPTGSFEDDLNP